MDLDGRTGCQGAETSDSMGQEQAEAPGADGIPQTGSGQSGQDLPLEDVIAQVEYCIEQLENPQLPLEESFRYYEEGVRKLKMCNAKVSQIEQKMQVINAKGELEDF